MVRHTMSLLQSTAIWVSVSVNGVNSSRAHEGCDEDIFQHPQVAYLVQVGLDFLLELPADGIGGGLAEFGRSAGQR